MTMIKIIDKDYSIRPHPDNGHLVYYKKQKKPVGYFCYDRTWDWWDTIYAHTYIGHSAIDTEQQALASVIDAHKEFLYWKKR